ncbi:MAG: response regulator [Bacteriovoracaceae bacterium]|nr:response regulator [Bacteriovoracaceae bacterium]
MNNETRGIDMISGKALVASQDAIYRKVIAKRLDSRGISVDTTNSGFEILKKLSEKDYDILIIDEGIEYPDGIAVVKLIREVHDSCNLPIIWLYRDHIKNEDYSVLNLDINQFVTIPISFPLLFNRIFLSLRVKKERENSLDAIETLSASKKKLEGLVSHKEEFVATIGHELKGPISGVMGLSNELLKRLRSEDEKNTVKEIIQSGHSLQRIVDDLLEMTRLKSGTFSLRDEKIDISQIFGEIFTISKFKAEAKNINLSFQIEKADNFSYCGDATRIKQVLQNLIDNAIKFTDAGSVIFSCKLIQQSSKMATLSFKVIDSGKGIKKEYTSSILRSHRQEDSSIFQKYGGTGLGLAICQNILKAMDSRLEIKSKSGEGSTFSFYLNLPTLKGTPKVDVKEGGSRECNILLVDDDLIHNKIFGLYLKDIPGSIETFNSAQDVDQVLESSIFDLIFIDFNINGTSGDELIGELKKKIPLERRPTVVLLTAETSEKVYELKKNGTVSDILQKPYGREELINCVKQWSALPFENNMYIDDGRLSELQKLSNNEQFLFEMYSIFEAESNKSITSLESGIDQKGLYKIVHTLRNTSHGIGAKRLETHCKRMIDLIENQEIENIVYEKNYLVNIWKKTIAEFGSSMKTWEGR